MIQFKSYLKTILTYIDITLVLDIRLDGYPEAEGDQEQGHDQGPAW